MKNHFASIWSVKVLSEDRIRLKNGEWQYIVRFSYERFLDFIMAKHLINILIEKLKVRYRITTKYFER